VLNKLTVMGNSTSIYTPWAPTQASFSKNFQSTCGPCSSTCANVHPCMNYEWTNIQLKVN
jgi:hypothetical protein